MVATDQTQLAVGIDLGGTKVAASLVNGLGEVLGRGHRPTDAARGLEAVLDTICAVVTEALAGVTRGARRQVVGVAAGAPGLVDAAAGLVILAPNLGWRDVPLGRLLSQRLELPVALENDANAAALGEHWTGAAAGRRDVLMITLGTGIGSGLILNGHLYRGARGYAGELGHLPLQADGPACSCGQRGCLEAVVSTPALLQQARDAVGTGRAPLLAKLARSRRGLVDIQVLLAAARQGDPVANEIIRTAGSHLGWALAGVAHLLNPELVVVGGGISRAGELLLTPTREAFQRRALAPVAAATELVAARLGNSAGMVGAARLALECYGAQRHPPAQYTKGDTSHEGSEQSVRPAPGPG